MKPGLVSDRLDSRLVLIDVQEKLCAAMPQPALQTLLKNCDILLQAAQLLDIPALHTEQYPKGLGTTLPALAQRLDPAMRVEKTCFSCCEESAFANLLDDMRNQIVLTGMEAHICILQTALQLKENGHQVFVVEDAVLSRNPANHANAMARLRQAGVVVSNTESVVFEWLKVAQGDAFKQISRLLR